MFYSFYKRHRGGVHLSPRWYITTTAATPTRHRGGVNFSLCLAKVMKGSEICKT